MGIISTVFIVYMKLYILITASEYHFKCFLNIYETFPFQYFSQNYGLQPKFCETQIAKISKVFNRTKLQMDKICKLKKNKKRSWKPLFEKNLDGYFSYKRFHRNPENFHFNQFLDIGKCTNALFLFKENLPELRQQFQFNDDILEAAQNVLQQVIVTKPTKKFVDN